MAPLPVVSASQYPELDTGIRWSALLALGVVLVSGMQGALGMESASYCRLSYGKLRVLLFLQAILAAAAISAQIHAFHQLSLVLFAPNAPLSWLQWEAACVLVLGLAIICIDTYAILAACAGSRVLWHPLSCAFRLSGIVQDTIARVCETFALLTSGCLTILLIGWRKHWWLESVVVQSNTRAEREAALSGGAEGVCIGVGVVVIGVVVVLIANFEGRRLFSRNLQKVEQPDPGVIELIRYMRRPSYWVGDKMRRIVMQRDASAEHLRVYRLLHEIGHGADQGISISRLSTTENLGRAPLHVGNTVISPDHAHVANPRLGVLTEILKICILVAANLSALPLLICVAVAVVRLRHVLDRDTLTALSALVDAVIVLALITVAVATKLAVWRAINFVDVHEYDVGPDDH